ncbi:MAG: hypothetical protein Q4Q20_02405 [Methanocorpusculum sp.]|nr:hypothetical protein [Methanocorpusculum sp.]
MKKIAIALSLLVILAGSILVAGCVSDSGNTEYSPIGKWVGSPLGETYALEFTSLNSGSFYMTMSPGTMTAEMAGLDVLGYSGDIKTLGGNARLEHQSTNRYSVIQTSVDVVMSNGQTLAYEVSSSDEENTIGYFDLLSNSSMEMNLKRGGSFTLNKVADSVPSPDKTEQNNIDITGLWKGYFSPSDISLNVVSSTEGYMKYTYPDKFVLATDVLGEGSGLTGYLRTIGSTVKLVKTSDGKYSVYDEDLYIDTYTGTTMNIPKSMGMHEYSGTIAVLSPNKITFTDSDNDTITLTKS